jgi:hypothetical protein
VKLYVEEAGSPEVRRLVEDAKVVATSVVAYPEARAALARQRREGGLIAGEYAEAKRAFERDWEGFLALGVSQPICRRAGSLAEKHRLRGFDSLHLSSYLALVAGSEGQLVTFSSFDRTLNRAASREARAARG